MRTTLARPLTTLARPLTTLAWVCLPVLLVRGSGGNDCPSLSGRFVDRNGWMYDMVRVNDFVTIESLNASASGWHSASGVVSPKPLFCPGGGATLQPACHNTSVQFDDGRSASALWDCHRRQLLSWSNKASEWFQPDPSITKVQVLDRLNHGEHRVHDAARRV